MSKTYYYKHHNLDQTIIISITDDDSTITSLSFDLANESNNFPKLKHKILIENLDNYFENGTELNFPLEFNGTDFQMQVWHEILKIPLGSTITYADLAKAIGKPKAYRAVANACGANSIALYIPCHRVCASNSIGGYAYGAELKSKLLSIENANY
jgi:O-6-methylguanine DNA methyltransferase